MNEPRSLLQYTTTTDNNVNNGLGITFSRPLTHHPRPIFVLPPDTPSTLQPGANVSMRSQTGMMGLVDAESGANFLTLTPSGSHFRSGTTVAPDVVAPTTSSRFRTGITESTSLDRQPTLFVRDATQERKVAELKNVLGKDQSGRLNSKAKVLPLHGKGRKRSASAPPSPIVALEQAKSRSRVELDLQLDSGTCVEGGYVKGKVIVNIRTATKKEGATYLGGGKLRIIGFEAIPHNDERHIFYHCGAPMERISPFCNVLYASDPDEKGFCRGNEGEHTVPFAMRLPPRHTNFPVAKGIYESRINGASIRYIAMVSIKIKDARANTSSISHIYRSIEVWPLLNPTIALAPTPSSLYATTSKSIFLGGSGKLKLTASLHRATWVAGQRCYVKIFIANDTEKRKVQTLTLELIRSETVFKPSQDAAIISPSGTRINNDMDACQTSTIKRIVARNVLEMGEKVSSKHATAKGWWTGVGCGSSLEFNHYILLPPYALTIPRTRLIEVSFVLQVGVGTGPLASEVSVQLPIRIVNYISLDPPPNMGPFESLDSPVSTVNPPNQQPKVQVIDISDMKPEHFNFSANATPIRSSGPPEDNGTYRGDNGMPAIGKLVVRNKATPEVASSMGIGRTTSSFAVPIHEEILVTQNEEPKEMDPAFEESNDGFVETECLAGHHSLRRSTATNFHQRQVLGHSGFGQWKADGPVADRASGFRAIGQAIQRPTSSKMGEGNEIHPSSGEKVQIIVRCAEPGQTAAEKPMDVGQDSISHMLNVPVLDNDAEPEVDLNGVELSHSSSLQASANGLTAMSSDQSPSQSDNVTSSTHPSGPSSIQDSGLTHSNAQRPVSEVPKLQIITTRPAGARPFAHRPRPQPIFLATGGLWMKTSPMEIGRSRGTTLRETVDLEQRSNSGPKDKIIAKEPAEDGLQDDGNGTGDTDKIMTIADGLPPSVTSATMGDIPRTVSALLAKELKTPKFVHSTPEIRQERLQSHAASSEAAVFTRSFGNIEPAVSSRPVPSTGLPLSSIQSRIAMFEQGQIGGISGSQLSRAVGKVPHFPVSTREKFRGGRL